MKCDNANNHHFIAWAHRTLSLTGRETRVFIKLSETIIHTIKNVLGPQNLLLSTTTWTNVHIMNSDSTHSAHVGDGGDLQLPTWCPHVIQPFRVVHSLFTIK